MKVDYSGMAENLKSDLKKAIEQNKETLKPCPFCGGEARLHKSIFIKYEATVICENCGARTLTHSSASYADVKMNAIKAWNNRKPLERVIERLEEYANDLKEDWDKYDNEDDFGGYCAVSRAIEIIKEELM